MIPLHFSLTASMASSHLPMTSVSSASQHKSLPTYALAAILAIPKRLLNFVSSTFIICAAPAVDD